MKLISDFEFANISLLDEHDGLPYYAIPSVRPKNEKIMSEHFPFFVFLLIMKFEFKVTI